MTTWEYKWAWSPYSSPRDKVWANLETDKGAAEWAAFLEEVGSAGWELVSVTCLSGPHAASFLWAFKRPKRGPNWQLDSA